MAPVSNASQTRPPSELYSTNEMSTNVATGFSNNIPDGRQLSFMGQYSPDPADNLLSNYLKTVKKNEVHVCSCKEGFCATSTCTQCSDVLCDKCVLAHQRVRITKDHKIVRFANDVNNIPDTLGSACSSQASSSPCNIGFGTSPYCDRHHDATYFCDSCSSPFCKECSLMEHRDHRFTYLQDAIDEAKANAVKLLTESSSARAAIREALDKCQETVNAITQQEEKAKREIYDMFMKFYKALETRQIELKNGVETVKKHKKSLLVVQKAELAHAMHRLGELSDQLSEIVDPASAIQNNGLLIIQTCEKANNELGKIRSLKSKLTPCEDENITFSPPEGTLLRAVASVGRVEGFSNMMLQNVVQNPSKNGIPMGRPVLGAMAPIYVRECTSIPIIIGKEGEGDGELCRPWGVCCDRFGHIIVADRSNNRIQIFHSNGVFSHKFGCQGTGPGQFDRPAGVALDPKGRIVVADKDNHRIQILTLDGTFVLKFGEKGSRSGQFNYPWDVAVNSMGNIVVSDTRNHRIQYFSNDGVFLHKYGFEGATAMYKHFDSPRGVCFTPRGNVIVTDFNNHRIMVIDNGKPFGIGGEGSGFNQFLRPQGIVCDDEGRIIVADSRNNRIQVFDRHGHFLWKVGQLGKGLGELDRPSGICLNPEGRIVVVDFGNDRVQIF